MTPLLWAPLLFAGTLASILLPIVLLVEFLDWRDRRSAVRRWDAICRAHDIHRGFEQQIRAIERVEDREDAKLRAARENDV
jgi:hypothetical protein